MNKEPDIRPYMATVKNSLKNLLKKNINHAHIYKINNAVSRTSTIVFHTYNFLSLYFMHLYKHNKPFPLINYTFIHAIMIVVSNRKDNRGMTAQLKQETFELIGVLMDFYVSHYRPLIKEEELAFDDKLTQALVYEADDIVKNININIAEHYIEHVNRLVNITFGVKNIVDEISSNKKLTEKEKKAEVSAVWAEFRKVKDDLLDPALPENTKYRSDPFFHIWTLEAKRKITPCKNQYTKNKLAYDVKVSPQDYLRCMFEINKQMNYVNNRILKNNALNDTNNPIYKLFHVLPLRTSIAPKHMTIDTSVLLKLLITENKGEYKGTIDQISKKVWSLLFNIDSRIFQKTGYQFNNMIRTDGVSCSILFVKMDKNNKPCRQPLKNELLEIKNNDCEYIENANITSRMKNMLMVAIDPNHGNLISCLAETKQKAPKKIITYIDSEGDKKSFINRNYLTFRYTRRQRNAETKKNKYRKIREQLKESTIVEVETTDEIKDKTVKEIETELSVHDSKNCNFVKFSRYLAAKINTNRELKDFYEMDIHRKLKFNTYVNTQKSETKMLRNFEKKFGLPGNVLIVFGDYDKIDTMHGCEPHISKRLRRILRVRGHAVYKINEYNTSKLCNRCEHEMERFKYCIGKDGKEYLLWSLLRCTNVTCKTIHNRDLNSPRNMLKIARNIINGDGRPANYTKKQVAP